MRCLLWLVLIVATAGVAVLVYLAVSAYMAGARDKAFVESVKARANKS